MEGERDREMEGERERDGGERERDGGERERDGGEGRTVQGREIERWAWEIDKRKRKSQCWNLSCVVIKLNMYATTLKVNDNVFVQETLSTNVP